MFGYLGDLYKMFRSVSAIVDDSKSGAVSKTLVVNFLIIVTDVVVKFFPNLPVSGELIDAAGVFLTAVVNMWLYVHTRKRVEKQAVEVNALCQKDG